jgi:trigger factor
MKPGKLCQKLTLSRKTVALTTKITNLEHSRIRLSVTIEKDELKKRYGKIVNDLAKQVQIPGFRKGKVPVSVLERKMGDVLKTDAVQKIVEDALDEIAKSEDFDKNFLPLQYSEPKLDEIDTAINLDADYTVSVTYDIAPQFSVENWKGLSVQVDTAEITDDDVNRELEELRVRNALVMDKDAGDPAVLGDIACIDYAELDGNGRPIDGKRREDWIFTIESSTGGLFSGDDIVGMKAGEKRVIKKDIAEAVAGVNGNNGAQGETVSFEITLKSLRKRELVDLDDDFAQDVDEKYKTLDALKAGLKDRLEKQLAAMEKNQKLNAIYRALIEKNPMDIPESMIKMGMVNHFRDIANNIGMTVEQETSYMTPELE